MSEAVIMPVRWRGGQPDLCNLLCKVLCKMGMLASLAVWLGLRYLFCHVLFTALFITALFITGLFITALFATLLTSRHTLPYLRSMLSMRSKPQECENMPITNNQPFTLDAA
ncbi:hypothetical protein PCI56_23600 [Plesiomonas shigelloides subsp. oncorhynchi]|nr:hypothetical protein [Plesiomonas shigelloides]